MRPKGSRILHHLVLGNKKIQIIVDRNNAVFTAQHKHQPCKEQKPQHKEQIPM